MNVLLSLAVLVPPVTAPAVLVPPDLVPSRRRPPRRARAWTTIGTAPGWPVGVVLSVQAALSLRLIWSDSAFPDEALYLWAGRLELGQWLHGTAVPPFATYMSGAPVLYPPIGALADSIGGLAAARLLSLALMLTTTLLLHGVTRRVFDRRSAFFAAALFAGLAGTSFLGAFATYDAMALCLLALATWLGIRAADSPAGRHWTTRRWTTWTTRRWMTRRGPGLAVAAGAVLALANATKYATGLFDPVLLVVTMLAVWRACGRTAAVRAVALQAGTLGLILGAGLLAAGQAYWQGLVITTLDRPDGTYSPVFVLYISGKWIGLVALLAVIGAIVILVSRPGWQAGALAGVLAAAAALAPAEQARIHTYTSLFKHDCYGAWFACIVAGFAVASLARAVPRAKSTAAFGVGLGLIALAAVPGVPWSGQQFGWPDSGPMIAAIRPVLARHGGPILSDDGGDLLHYYLGPQVDARPVVNTWWFTYTDPWTHVRQTGLAAYRDAIAHHYFGVVVLGFRDTLATDDALHRAVIRAGYRRVAWLPYTATGTRSGWGIWVRAPGS
jgi:hypothetical protein